MKKILLIAGILILVTGGLFFFKKTSLTKPAEVVVHSEMTAHEHEKTAVPNIDKAPESQIADRDKMLALLKPNDPDSIFLVVDALQSDPRLAVNCHEIAHDIGHHAYEMYGFSDAMTFDNPKHVQHALVQNICAGGYLHGILEELSLHEPGFIKKPEIVCDNVPLEDQASCYHGMGHVFMLANKRDAPASIMSCRVIQYSGDMYRCFEGVRMEQFWGGNATSSAKLGWDPENPLGVCVDAQTDEKPTCFLYATFGYLRFHPKDYSGAAQLCSQSKLPNLDDQFCLKGLGMTMMSKFKGKNMEGSEQYAVGLTTPEKYAFYQGVIGYSSLSGLSDEQLKNACSLLKEDRLVCEDALINKK